MDFSLTTLFVVPVGNTLPTSGGTESLADGQVGAYVTKARTIATAANIATSDYVEFAQGRPSLGIGSKKSDKIYAKSIQEIYKATGTDSVVSQTTTVSAFTVPKGEDFVLTLRLFGFAPELASYNGLTRSYVVPHDCFKCGDSACENADPESIVDALIEKYNQEASVQTGTAAIGIPTFFTFTKEGTGANTSLLISLKPQPKDSKFCDVSLAPFFFDRLSFRTFAYFGPDTTADFIVQNDCNNAATVTINKRSNYAHLTSDEIAQLEIDYYSYQSPVKELYRKSGFNPYFQSFVSPGNVYDVYYIRFNAPDDESKWSDTSVIDETVIFAIPQGESAGLVALITALATKAGVTIQDYTGGTYNETPITVI